MSNPKVYTPGWPTAALQPIVVAIDQRITSKDRALNARHPFAQEGIDSVVQALLTDKQFAGYDQDELKAAVVAMEPHFRQVRESTAVHSPSPSPDGDECEQRRIRVQHCVSGIYLYAMMDRDDYPFVTVEQVNNHKFHQAKRERWLGCPDHRVRAPWLQSLSAEEDEPQRMRYIGMGLGQLLYRKLAELHPDRRFRTDSLKPSADRVRKKLHREDPWTWHYPGCDVCGRHIRDDGWAQAASAEKLAERHR